MELTASVAAGCCRGPSPAGTRLAAAPRLGGGTPGHGQTLRHSACVRAYVCACVCVRITQQRQPLDVGADAVDQSAGVLGKPGLVGHDEICEETTETWVQ